VSGFVRRRRPLSYQRVRVAIATKKGQVIWFVQEDNQRNQGGRNLAPIAKSHDSSSSGVQIGLEDHRIDV
jgi:hypothetical protein